MVIKILLKTDLKSYFSNKITHINEINDFSNGISVLEIKTPVRNNLIKNSKIKNSKIKNVKNNEINRYFFTPQQMIIICVLIFSMISALSLRSDFTSVCSVIGSILTISNLLLLPLAFYHKIMKNKKSIFTFIWHFFIFTLAIFIIFIGAGGNICMIYDNNLSFCKYIT
jgi:amino acid permease